MLYNARIPITLTENVMSDKETPEVIEDLDFELIIGDAGGQIDNGDVPIRWCMKPDFVVQLEAHKIVDPHVLISSFYPDNNTENYSNEMDRKLVPLSELMTYLRFTKAGKCKVIGVILDGSCGRKELWDMYMRKDHNGYKTSIVSSWDGEIHSNIEYSEVVTSDFVSIPENVFGREPSPWLKWYVNLWHNSHNKITDECDFRKRFLIAFIFKWIVFLPFIIGLTLFRVGWAGGVLACGYFKKVRFFRAFRPYKYPSVTYNVLDDVDVIEDNMFVISRPCFTGNGKTTKMLSGLAFTPIVALAVAFVIGVAVEANGFGGFLRIEAVAIATIFSVLMTMDVVVMIVETLIRFHVGDKIGHGILGFLGKLIDMLPTGGIPTKYQKMAILGLFGIVGIVIIGFAFKYLLTFLGIFLLSIGMSFAFFFLLLVFANQILDWLDNFFAMSAKDNNYGNITELLCPKDEDNLRPNYKYIPKKQRTVRLWYHDLKNKVCKPMQS